MNDINCADCCFFYVLGMLVLGLVVLGVVAEIIRVLA
jgi:hypothetical protein